MKILVTGAAGFIGSNIVEALVQRGDWVFGLDNLSTGRMVNLKCVEGNPNFEFIKGDIRDAALVEKTARGVDVIFHEAALPSVQRSIENPHESLDNNVNGTVNVLWAAKNAGVQRVVFASSSSIYGNVKVQPVDESAHPQPISPYGASKIAGEMFGFAFAASYGFTFIALRYFNVFGPRQDPESEYAAVVPRFITRLNKGTQPPVIYGDGEQTRDFTFVSNVVHANLLAADKPGLESGFFNIAAGRPNSVNDLLRTICTFVNKPFRPVYEPPRVGDIVQSSAAIGKSREAFGYAPVTDFRRGLEMTCDAFTGKAVARA